MIEPRLLEHFSSTVAQIYAAALDPALWPIAVQSIASLHGSPKANLLTPTTSPNNGGFIFPFGIPESAIQLWGTRYITEDIWAQRVLEKKLMQEGNVILGSELVTWDELEKSKFYSEFLRKLDIWHLCTGIVFDGQRAKQPLTAVSLFKGRNTSGFSKLNRKLYGLTVNHLSRSLGTMFKLRDAELRLAATYAALDRMTGAVILLGERGNVLFANRAAMHILTAGDGLGVKRGNPLVDSVGWITAARSSDQAMLMRQIGVCIRPQMLEIDHFSSGVQVQRPSGKRSYIVQLSTLPLGNEFSKGEAPSSAIAFVSDPENVPVVDRQILQATFGLTEAECSLAQEMLSGDQIEDIARRLEVSDNTIKSHLKSVYEKTGTHRQAQLMKLLMGLASAAQ